MAQTIFQVLDCRDLGRIDFRLSDAGVPYFLEINALPSLEPGAGIYAAAALEGLHLDGVIGSIIQSAAQAVQDQGLGAAPGQADAQERPAARGLHLQRQAREAHGGRLGGQRGRVRLARHAPGHPRGHRLAGATRWSISRPTRSCPACWPATPVDIVFNIAEGFKGRNRESQVPAHAGAAGHPVHGLRSGHAVARAGQGAGEEDRPPGRHPHAQLPADDHRQGAPQQGVHQLPADGEAGGRGLLQGRGAARASATARRSCARW